MHQPGWAPDPEVTVSKSLAPALDIQGPLSFAGMGNLSIMGDTPD
jgi:hypothetical protein